MNVKLLARRGFQIAPLARGFALMRDSLVSEYIDRSSLIVGLAPLCELDDLLPKYTERADRDRMVLAVEVPDSPDRKQVRARFEDHGFCFSAQLYYGFCGVRHPTP